MKKPQPPHLAERILFMVLPIKDRQAVLGDFSEFFGEAVNKEGLATARRRYWLEVFSSAPHFLYKLINNQLYWRQPVKSSTLFQSGRKTALWGFLFLIPALFIAIPGVLFTLFGYTEIFDSFRFAFNQWDWLVHPAVVLGGLAMALFLNLFSVLKLSVENDEEELVSTISIKKSVWNFIPLLLGGLLAAVIFLYLIAENFGPFF